MIRVMYVCHEAKLNGAGRSLIDFLQYIDRNKIEPIVILPNSGPLEHELYKLNIAYFITHYQKNCTNKKYQLIEENRISQFKSDYICACEISKLIMKHKIQVVHTNTSVVNVGIIAAMMSNVPHIWHLREFLEEDFNLKVYDKKIFQFLLEASDVFLSISKSVQEYWLKEYGIPSLQLYDGIDLKKYEKNEKYEECDKNNQIRIIIAGTISPNKGQFDAIRAIELLKQQQKFKYSLDIIGNGDENFVWYLKKYILVHQLQDCIRMQRFRNDLEQVRSEYDISLTCSKKEGLGRVTIEAMLAGNIVIGSKSGGTEELIGTDEKRGKLYTYGDYKQLADKIQYVAENYNFMHTFIASKASKYVSEICNPNIYAKKVEDIYNVLSLGKRKDNKMTLEHLQEQYEKNKNIEPIRISRENMEEMYKSMYWCAEHWLRLKYLNVGLENFFVSKNIFNIAVRGLGPLGQDLVDELDNSVVRVKCIVDGAADIYRYYQKVISPEEDLKDVDAVVITVFQDVDILRREYKDKGIDNIFSISEIVENVWNSVIDS